MPTMICKSVKLIKSAGLHSDSSYLHISPVLLSSVDASLSPGFTFENDEGDPMTMKLQHIILPMEYAWLWGEESCKSKPRVNPFWSIYPICISRKAIKPFERDVEAGYPLAPRSLLPLLVTTSSWDRAQPRP